MVLSSMQLQEVSVTLWFRRLQCLELGSVLSVFINLRSAECVCSYYGLRVCDKQINELNFATVVWWASHNVLLNPFCVNAFTPRHICEACFVLGNWRYSTLRQGQIDIKPLKYVGCVVGQIFQCDISGHSPVEIKNPVPVCQARFRQFGVIESFHAESMKAATNAMIAGHSIQKLQTFYWEYWRSCILSYSA